MAMATMLIDQLVGTYDPTQHEDEYRIALERVIESKLSSQPLVTADSTAPTGKVIDLMEALRASIAATQKQRTQDEPQAEEEGNRRRGAGQRAPRCPSTQLHESAGTEIALRPLTLSGFCNALFRKSSNSATDPDPYSAT